MSSDVGLNASFIDEMIHRMSIKRYNPGEYIVRKGEVGQEMFFITRGVVEIHIPNKVINLTEGAFFGEVALFLDQVRMASVTAQTEADVLVLKKKVLDKVLTKYPEIAEQFAELGRMRLAQNAGGTTGTKETSGAAWMNQIAEMSVGYDPTVQVVIRVRPKIMSEIKKPECFVIEGHNRIIGRDPSLPADEAAESEKPFKFDYVFGPDSNNEEVYAAVGLHITNAVFDMFNTCVFAYGQVATGKTYTVSSMLELLCEDIFKRVDAECAAEEDGGTVSFQIQVSHLEIFCERLRDLLLSGRRKADSSQISIRGTPGKGIYVEALTKKVVTSFDEAMHYWSMGEANRVRAGGSRTNVLESKSSPGHAIFTMYIRKVLTHAGGEQVTDCKLNIVDLAGTQQEADSALSNQDKKLINTSLLSLSLVINKLAFEAKSIPYRQSKLTMLLAESFGGNSKTYMIATLNPVDMKNGLRTLHHAQYAMNIVNKAVRALPKGDVLKSSLSAGMAKMFEFNAAARAAAPQPPSLEEVMRLIEEANTLCGQTGNNIIISVEPHSELASNADYGVRLTDFNSTRTVLWDPLTFVDKLNEERSWVSDNWDDESLGLKEATNTFEEPFYIPPTDRLIGTVCVPLSNLVDLSPSEDTYTLDTLEGSCAVRIGVNPMSTGALADYVDSEIDVCVSVSELSDVHSPYRCGMFVKYSFPEDEVDEHVNSTARGPEEPFGTFDFGHGVTYTQTVSEEFVQACANEDYPDEISFEVWGHEPAYMFEPATLREMLAKSEARVAELEGALGAEKTRADSAESELADVTAQLSALKEKVAAEHAAIKEKVRSKLEENKNKMEETEGALKRTKVSNTFQRAAAAAVRSERDEASARVAELEAEADQLRQELTILMSEADDYKKEATEKQAELESEVLKLQEQLQQSKGNANQVALSAEAAAGVLNDKLHDMEREKREDFEEMRDLKTNLSTKEKDLAAAYEDLHRLRKEHEDRVHAFEELCRMYKMVARLATKAVK